MSFRYPKEEIVKIAEAILADKIHLVQGCRKILSLLTVLNCGEPEAFLPLIGFYSESHHFPLEPELRQKFEPAYLASLDAEIEAQVTHYRPMVLNACKET